MLTLVVISSIALMVGGIGVMAIMMISVTGAHAGDRRAQGPRRQAPRHPLAVPARSRVPDRARRPARRRDAAAGVGLAVHLKHGLPGLAARGGRSRSASVSRRTVGIFFGISPGRSKPRGSIPSRRSGHE